MVTKIFQKTKSQKSKEFSKEKLKTWNLAKNNVMRMMDVFTGGGLKVEKGHNISYN